MRAESVRAAFVTADRNAAIRASLAAAPPLPPKEPHEMRLLEPERLGAPQAKLLEGLRAKVIAQEDALRALADAVQRFRIGLHPPNRPPGIFLCVGPTGSGKTMLAKALAHVVTGKPLTAPIRIDCAEFRQSHETARLLGAPAGFIGHRETAPLITDKKLLEQCTPESTPAQRLSFVLFDEVDKAHESLLDLLLGIFDHGSLQTGDGKTVDFSSTFIIMTANTGSKEITNALGKPYGLSGAAEASSHANPATAGESAARRILRPEFFNRLDRVLVFAPLTPADIRQILDLELEQLDARLRMSNGIRLDVTPEARDFLATDGFDARYGARHLKRAIEQRLTVPISNLISSGQVGAALTLRVSLEESGVLQFHA